ncbi:mannose-1-phosphate guanylyltransferase [Neiella marina]|uniref:Mannose-1-phosphate guanylyltransferase n=1 Tax=Neiella marina TaxID=508461 RepID=A0A8J2U2T1_9GAMM|nr:nucleotidyltransferase family protein [Neiella marina]GGA67800.1 mannose-1-phosphate guanylyltransferase [Neiella marina]
MITTAMILAAGRGERMRPLTDTMPKPMLSVGGKPLIIWHLEKLAASGVERVVINLAHLSDKIEQGLGNGEQFGVTIVYSHEQQGALETAGGIVQALPHIGDNPFWLVNGDVWTDWSFSGHHELQSGELAKLVLVNNPEHNPDGDFAIDNQGYLSAKQQFSRFTYSGIGLYSPELFAACQPGKAPLAPLLKAQLDRQTIAAEHFRGQWCDVGTPQRLAALNQQMES